MAREISHFVFSGEYFTKYKFAFKLIRLLIYFHYKLYKNASIANFVYYSKTQVIVDSSRIICEFLFRFRNTFFLQIFTQKYKIIFFQN